MGSPEEEIQEVKGNGFSGGRDTEREGNGFAGGRDTEREREMGSPTPRVLTLKTPLLEEFTEPENESSKLYTGDGSVDKNGNPVLKQNTGNWKACILILGTECCEHLAYYGISANLVSYFTDELHLENASAASNVTSWQGTCYLTPLLGATLADAFLGRYWTITAFSTVYFIGLCTLTFSASFPAHEVVIGEQRVCSSDTRHQSALFFLGLYLIALGTGGIKPCVSAFGADQFDDTDPTESVKKGPFFNWYYFSISIGALISSTFLVWIKENFRWAIAFGIPTVCMLIAITCFFFSTHLYRFHKPRGCAVKRMCQVLVASFHKWNLEVPADSSLLYETQTPANDGSLKIEHSDGLKFLDKAAVIIDEDFSNKWKLCTVTQVEELKTLIGMLPICVTGIFFAAVYVQTSTTFVEQGNLMSKSFGSFDIPPAAVSCFDLISVIIWVPVYDRLIVPFARRFTGRERGFSELQRMGIGIGLSFLSMLAATMVESYRLGHVPMPPSIFWQIPQYFVMGAAEVLVFIGQLEFFYDESPSDARSLYNALALVTISFGDYLNAGILKMVNSFTSRGGRAEWIPNNLNEGHLDYFFWLLVVFSLFNTLLHIFFALRYKPKQVF